MSNTQLFRKVMTADRFPEIENPVIAVFETGEVAKVGLSESGYWFPYDYEGDCDQPEYWFELIPEYTNQEIQKLQEKLQEGELIIYGIEEGAAEWQSKCSDLTRERDEWKQKYEELAEREQRDKWIYLEGKWDNLPPPGTYWTIEDAYRGKPLIRDFPTEGYSFEFNCKWWLQYVKCYQPIPEPPKQ